MERMIERCAGLDVRQASVVVCILISERGRRRRKELHTFGTMTTRWKPCATGWLRNA